MLEKGLLSRLIAEKISEKESFKFKFSILLFFKG